MDNTARTLDFQTKEEVKEPGFKDGDGGGGILMVPPDTILIRNVANGWVLQVEGIDPEDNTPYDETFVFHEEGLGESGIKGAMSVILQCMGIQVEPIDPEEIDDSE